MVVALLCAAAVWAGDPCPPGIRRAAAEVARVHGTRPVEVRCERVDGDELTQRLVRRLGRDLPLPLSTYLEALDRLGLLEGYDPAQVAGSLVEFLAFQVLGYYDPEEDRMILVDRPGLESVAPLVWAHELEHADQQHRFGLPARVLSLASQSDAQLAAAAVAEGDAVLVMAAVAVAAEHPSAAELGDAARQMLDQLGAVEDAVRFPGVPRFFVRQLLFPYLRGLELVTGELLERGWAGVEALERDPPASTEQVLHPDRRTDDPTPVPTEALGELGAGFSPVYTDTVGEWALGEWLAMVLGREAARVAAAGWDGDRLRLARDGEIWRLDLVTVWDSETDAHEALQAFLCAMPRLLRLGPGGTTVRVRRRGLRVRVRALGVGTR